MPSEIKQMTTTQLQEEIKRLFDEPCKADWQYQFNKAIINNLKEEIASRKINDLARDKN